MKSVNSKLKRLIDITTGILGIILFGLIIFLTAISIYITMGRPIFFVQTRPGLKEKLFKLWKFRTMKMPSSGEKWLFSDKERITFIGKIIRKYSIDELPQFWNLLKGDLSLVGPRPLLKEYLPIYTRRQRHRHDVKPGITGWAQVNGLRGATPNPEIMKKRMEFDLWYLNNWSIWLDFYIILKTFYALARYKGD